MTKITIETTVEGDLDKVWDAWTKPENITKWNFASDDWECPSASVELREGGKFSARMAAKDGSFGFDFEGIYTKVIEKERIEYEMEDKRKVEVSFEQTPKGVRVIETFDAEETNSEEMQRQGWQAILENFKKYVESK